MDWIEVCINTTNEATEAVSYMLMSMGSGGVVIESPYDTKKEIKRVDSIDYLDDELLNSVGEDVLVKSYFPGDKNRSELTYVLREKINNISQFLNTGKAKVLFSDVREQDWANSWKKYYKPFHISKSVVIKPSWEQYEAVGSEIVIEMDPGMAFGTGTHDTTRMCAVLLDKYINEGNTVLDVGCGTGVLSIISVKLGASSVTAIDIDTVAVRAAEENCGLNGVGNHVQVKQGTLENIELFKADIVVANIIADVIIRMSGELNGFLNTDGYFIASGIIKEREEEVVKKYTQQGFYVFDRIESGEWVAIVFKCLDSL